tara:strand:+ start:156 stop:476 length:321 start_codon:yes stop_codon:yes gene_type:complete
MDNELAKYIDISINESNNVATVTVKLQAENPRKNVPSLFFGVEEARKVAASKYGARLGTVVESCTLQNGLHGLPLEGSFSFQLTPKATKRTKTTKSRRTTKTTTEV